MKAGKIKALFSSNVEEIKPRSVTLAGADGKSAEIPNDFVFIFAGGELPTELLKKAGVRLRGTELDLKAA